MDPPFPAQTESLARLLQFQLREKLSSALTLPSLQSLPFGLHLSKPLPWQLFSSLFLQSAVPIKLRSSVPQMLWDFRCLSWLAEPGMIIGFL